MEGCRDQAWMLLLGQLSHLKSHRFRFFWKALIDINTVASQVEDAGVKYLMLFQETGTEEVMVGSSTFSCAPECLFLLS